MNERRPLGSGPRPAAPPAPPTAARRARLAAEGAPTPTPTETAAGERPEQPHGWRTLGPGAPTDR
ncbi:hypothetical protein [Streptomyces sp. NPDC093093]|uniref:hypothetical protein n=1 Tax=Streptomyces sp. NPDC093093 TaxID=3366025 RepID=UPI00381A4049